jgi:hypothetical protein
VLVLIEDVDELVILVVELAGLDVTVNIEVAAPVEGKCYQETANYLGAYLPGTHW